MLEDYLKVKTGQDLIDLGVVPKTSSEHLSLITYKRLIALKDRILARISDEALGTWMPAVEEKKKKTSQGSVTEYKLVEGVVADKRLGHIVRFNNKYDLKFYDGYSTNIIEIPEGTSAVIAEYSPKAEKITLRIDEDIPKKGKKSNFEFMLKDLYDKLDVSSLGGKAPLEKEAEVKKQTLIDYFPKTVLDPKRAEMVIKSLLMGKDMILYGPPGSGKSNLAKDIIAIAMQQGTIFIVEGCKVQCNPFSLFDENFAAIVSPCPDCMIQYDKDFKKTGRFKRPKPKDVHVTVADYTEGYGIAFIEGTLALRRMHLAGFKLPKLDGTTTAGRENEYDPEGFSPGALPRTNNGILHMDEMDKLLPQTLDGILEALNSSRMKPDELRYSYPANGLIIGTANDNSVFSDALNDRMLLLGIYYHDDSDVNYAVTKKGYYGKVVPLSEVPVGDTHKEKAFKISSVTTPVIIEKAIETLYMKIRDEYNGPGKKEVFGSNRSKFDALDDARASRILDQFFLKDTPPIVNAEYAMDGIKFAVCSRVQETNKEEGEKARTSFCKWVEEEFPKVLKGEEDAWWCEAYKHLSIAKVQIPEIEGNFIKELVDYDADPKRALQSYAKVKKAYDSPKNEKAQLARVECPFMDYLFKEQPRFDKVDDKQLIGLLTYLMESSKNTVCKIVPEENK